MSTLQENLDAIKLDKDTNLKPENLKVGVTCLGVNGRLQNGCKLFETEENMLNDKDVKYGDLAAIYRNEIANCTSNVIFSSCIFPDTVVLPQQVTDSIHFEFNDIGSGSLRVSGSLYSNHFYVSCMGAGMLDIDYESQDGITYTRSDIRADGYIVEGNTVYFGTNLQADENSWNDLIGYFMQVNSDIFGGIFQYTENADYDNLIYPISQSDLDFSTSPATFTANYDKTRAISVDLLKDIILNNNLSDFVSFFVLVRINNEWYVGQNSSGAYFYDFDGNVGLSDAITNPYKITPFGMIYFSLSMSDAIIRAR